VAAVGLLSSVMLKTKEVKNDAETKGIILILVLANLLVWRRLDYL
jgi:hypothetical protein